MSVNRSVLGSSSPSNLNRSKTHNYEDEKPPAKRLKKISDSIDSMSKYSQFNDFEDTAILRKREVISDRRQRLSDLRSKVSTLITKKEEHELNHYELDEKYSSLKKELNLVESQLEEMKELEYSSLQRLHEKLSMEKKSAQVDHNNRVNEIKEKYTAEAEAIITKGEQEYRQKLNSMVQQLNDTKNAIKLEDQESNRKLIKLKEEYHKKHIQQNMKLDDSIRSFKDELLNKEIERESKTKELKSSETLLEQDLSNSKVRLTSLFSQLEAKFAAKESEVTLLENNIINKKSQIDEIKTGISNKSNRIKEYNLQVQRINESLSNYEHRRRNLHNRLQELKGNIRVFCRIRPIQDKLEQLSNIEVTEDEINENSNQELTISNGQDMESNSYSLVKSNGNSYTFQFDKVFNSRSHNPIIFEEISQLIQSSLDGYNVCVFAYGQTGSGKTYTMSHPQDGMIPLSLGKIFSDIEELKSKGWEYTVRGQFIEIYNENIVDLLAPSDANLKYEIKHDDIEAKTTVTNIHTIQITSEAHANSILSKATNNRSTAFTKSNDRSSRSHLIFIFKLHGVNAEKQITSEGTLNLIDLAGSERLVASQAKGDRLKETQAINKSLSCLGDVIYSLGQKQNNKGQHIPYRNSKLTYLLKHSLGGNSKTLMFVNISPSQKNFSETVNSLRFATKVNSTKLQQSRPSSR